MPLTQFYIKNRDKWWGLPLVLPALLLPLAQMANTYSHIDGGLVSLYFMPLPLLLSIMLFFGWKALPGMVLGILLVITPGLTPLESLGIIFYFLVPVILSWGGYRVFVPHRHSVSYGNPRLLGHRLFWQMLLPAMIFQLIMLFSMFFSLLPSRFALAGNGPLTLHSLINFQSLLLGCLTGVPLCYLIIRIIRNPHYLRGVVAMIRREIDPKVTIVEMVLWFAILFTLVGLLLVPLADSDSIFTTNYTLSLLLPVMLWGAMRFGYRLIFLIWVTVQIISVHYYYRYLPVTANYSNQMAIVSSSFLVFSFIVVYMAMLATQRRKIFARMQRMAYIDPVVHLPNLWALSRRLAATPWSVLCFLRIPELEVFGRHYGMMVRIQYKQNLALWLDQALQPGESVYQLSGHDLAMRLNMEGHERRVQELDALIKRFRFIWDGVPLQPGVGVGYCTVRAPVVQLPMLLGELSTTANMSLITGNPENLQHRSAIHLQQRLKNKVTMMHQLQRALEHDKFQLLAQPIMGIRGDRYYEVLLRLEGDDNTLIKPEDFLPAAQEFGLSSRIDLWVLERALSFLAQHRDRIPGQRLSINISSTSACGPQFTRAVPELLRRYNIQPWQIIFEITECQSFTHPEQAMHNMELLQELGCRIAIDDFGTGYASYARLKQVNADILKINGSFIQNLMTSALDYQIVLSICHLARMKNMLVVAEHIETKEVRDAAQALGIDYLQGFYIGKPEPLGNLAAVER